MKKANRYSLALMSTLRSLKAIYLYFGLLFVLSFGAQLLLSQDVSTLEEGLKSHNEYLVSNASNKLNNPFSLPAIPESPEDGDEDDRDDRLEDELTAVHCLSSSESANSYYILCAIAQFQRVVENKSLPSLYILYHSWKSFLA